MRGTAAPSVAAPQLPGHSLTQSCPNLVIRPLPPKKHYCPSRCHGATWGISTGTSRVTSSRDRARSHFHILNSDQMAKTPSKKSGKSAKKGAEGKRKKRRVETFSSYIYKVLKQVHPDTGISKRAMSIMNRCVGRVSLSLCPRARARARA